jgi:hypothetical protein
MKRWLPLLLPLLTFVGVFHRSNDASAARGKIGQGQASNPPASLRPRATNTGFEIGIGTHIHIEPDTFLPRFRMRYQFSQTAAQGVLSGLWLEAAAGPAIFFGGSVGGNFAFNLGYEFDPFSNLALTFSPVLRNDIIFHPPASYVGFIQTYGLNVRLYINSNWIFFVDPSAFGWHLWNVPGRRGVQFAWQGGAGFGYKF